MNLLGASTRQERRCSAPFGMPQTRLCIDQKKKNCSRDLDPELYFFPSPIFPRESVKNDRKTEREAVRSFCPPRSIRYFRYKVLSGGNVPAWQGFHRMKRGGNVTWAWHVRVGKTTFMPALFSRRCERALGAHRLNTRSNDGEGEDFFFTLEGLSSVWLLFCQRFDAALQLWSSPDSWLAMFHSRRCSYIRTD